MSTPTVCATCLNTKANQVCGLCNEPVCKSCVIAMESEAFTKDVYFLTKAYPGYVRVLRKHTKRVVVEDCADRRDTIVRMAFFAAELGFNAIIEAEVESFKTRSHGYLSSRWKGSAMPAQIDGEQLERASLRRL